MPHLLASKKRPWRLYGLVSLLLLASFFARATEGELRVGVYDNPPLSLMQEGEATGFAIDILQEVAKKEGWNLTYQPCAWDECLAMLEAGDIDLLTPIAYSEERAQRFDFNQQTILNNWGTLYVSKNSDVMSVVDLQGKTVAALQEDIYTPALADLLSQFNIRVNWVYVEDYEATMLAVENGTADVAVVNRLFALRNAVRHPSLRATGILFHPIEVRVAATKGRHQSVLAAFDRDLKAMQDDPNSPYYMALEIWLGNSVLVKAPPYLLRALSMLAILASLLIGGAYWLQRQVQQRTKQLRKSEARWRVLVEEAADPILLISRDGRILDANPAACQALGYTYEALRQQPVTHVEETLTDPAVAKEMWRQLQSGQTTTMIGRAVRADGSTFPVEARLSLVEHEGETAWLAVARDITERLQIQQTLEKHNRELELLRQASLRLTSELSLSVVLDAMLEYALILVPADDAHIFIYDGERMTFGAARWANGRSGVPWAMPRENGLTYTVARTGKRKVVPDMSQDPLFTNWPGQASPEGGIAGFPLLYQGKVIGVMNIAFAQPHDFSERELRLLALLADQAAVAIANARLVEQLRQQSQDLDKRVAERTAELQRLVNVMVGRELRMKELKDVIRRLKQQLRAAGLEPVADDPLGTTIDNERPEENTDEQ